MATAVEENTEVAEESAELKIADETTHNETAAAEAEPVEGSTPEAAAAEAAPPAADPPAPVPVDDAADLRELRHWEVRLAEAEKEVASCVGVVNSLKIDLKEAKKAVDEAVADMRFLVRERSRRYPLFDAAKKATVASPANVEAAAAEESPAVDPDAWKATPISVLDLGETLETKLNDGGIKTIGELETLRADEFKGLKSIKGIGQAKADAIEEKILDWLTRNRDAGALKVESSAETAGKALQDRATFLANTGGSLDLNPADDANWYESGRTAYGLNADLTECPCIPGPEQDSWLRGWMYAQSLNEAK